MQVEPGVLLRISISFGAILCNLESSNGRREIHWPVKNCISIIYFTSSVGCHKKKTKKKGQPKCKKNEWYNEKS